MLWGFCRCSFISSQKIEGKPNLTLMPGIHVLCPEFMFSCVQHNHYFATFNFQAYIMYHLKALLELCDMSVLDFSIFSSIAKFWWFEEGGLEVEKQDKQTNKLFETVVVYIYYPFPKF